MRTAYDWYEFLKDMPPHDIEALVECLGTRYADDVMNSVERLSERGVFCREGAVEFLELFPASKYYTKDS